MSNAARLAVLAAALSSILTACAGATPAPPTLAGRTFLSTGVDGRALVAGSRIQLRFADGADLGASAGCNTIGGTYRLDGNVLVVTAGGMTEMGCDPERHQQDDWLAAFLSSRPTFSLDGNDLTLGSGGTTIRLLDREVAEPDLPIAGPVWTLDSIISGDAVSSVPGGVVATLTVHPDGTVELSPGCNGGSSTITTQGDQLRFGPILTTKMACQGPAGDVERTVLGVLGGGPLTFSIDASVLTLRDPNGNGLGFRAG